MHLPPASTLQVNWDWYMKDCLTLRKQASSQQDQVVNKCPVIPAATRQMF